MTVNLNRKSMQLLKHAQLRAVGKLADPEDETTVAPFSMVLEPYRLRASEFQKIKKLGFLWQKLAHAASKDQKLILQTFKNNKNDLLISQMINIYKATLNQQNCQQACQQSSKNQVAKGHLSSSKPSIDLFRSDFFVTDDVKDNIKLVQYNTMSVSMAGVSQEFQKCQQSLWGNEKKVLENNSTQVYAAGLSKFYRENKLQGILLAVVQNREVNLIDQKLLFSAIKKHINIDVERVLLEDLDKQTSINQEGDLFYKNKKVAIVYYRSGYSSRERIQWEGIKKCNISNAINIPSANSFLINSKRMQAELSKKQVMQKYLTEEEANFLHGSVAETWEFEQVTKQEILEIMERNGTQNFVLKPNEEGGKNNFFGNEAYNKVKQSTQEELYHYILTRRIVPRRQSSTIVRGKNWEATPELLQCDIEGEVSVYGCICSYCPEGSDKQCLENTCEGYLVRCKPKEVNEGGIMAGTGALGVLELEQE